MTLRRKSAFGTLLIAFLLLLLVMPGGALAARTWADVATDTQNYLVQAAKAYRGGDPVKAKQFIDDGYFGPFEAEGMEATIKTHISAQRAFELEQEFKQLKMLINKKAAPSEIQSMVDSLGSMLQEDAAKLDGGDAKEASSTAPFMQSLLIILREGFEAILVLSAIIAYLVKSGNKDKTRTVYIGAAGALVVSAIAAVILRAVVASSGAYSQELLEGITMLTAVVVLFWVSYWLLGKVQAQKWQEYISSKVESSLTGRNTLALATAAFLAVFREGAETILFYEALIAGNPASLSAILMGLGLGSVILVGIFLLFRYGSVRIPIKPFFIATGALLYYLAFVFAGQGMRELQEAGVIGSTRIPGLTVIDLLGIYPTWETLSLQIVLVVLAVAGVAWTMISSKRKAQSLAQA